MEVSTNLGRVSLVPRGEYDPAAAYRRLDVVPVSYTHLTLPTICSM